MIGGDIVAYLQHSRCRQFIGKRLDGRYEIKEIIGQSSHHNGAKLIQDREIYLNYMYSNGDGTTTVVTDTLKFRNRMRDGVNEWQDENPENYN